MRPPRLILLLLCFLALPTLLTFFSLLSSHPSGSSATTATDASSSRSSRFRALFSFNSPASLFPPSAIISLTDDNSTFFLARPAAFGPTLPSKGLSGQLWIGSGFGDDSLRKGGIVAGSEGELGCSDVPGWGEGKTPQDGLKAKESAQRKTMAKPQVGADEAGQKLSKSTRAVEEKADAAVAKGASSKAGAPSLEDDGTDDYLHRPLSNSDKVAVPGQKGENGQKTHDHADIQSIQESAEIAGKVVLLSRGGCGFLEKAKWVQRRGGTALIVGDNTRGGGLVTMYAHGDTSNITIPALFTSHTTAHLLSSLIPPNGAEDAEDATATRGRGSKGASSKDKPSFTIDDKASKTNNAAGKSTTAPSRGDGDGNGRSWFQTFLSTFGLGHSGKDGLQEDSRRPPTSGNIDWVLLEDWEEDDKVSGTETKASPKKIPPPKQDDKIKNDKSYEPITESPASADGFEIGVQDWRDPDLVAASDMETPAKAGAKPSKAKAKAEQTPPSNKDNGLKGGSITPGSGEYIDPATKPDGKSNKKGSGSGSSSASNPKVDAISDDDDGWWFSGLTWGDDDEEKDALRYSATKGSSSKPKNTKVTSSANDFLSVIGEHGAEGHEGLWVTLSPTSMSSSPFFDTLLVLVVSPLITLTVVYALLLVRSRIRRRRWRAPKSVVDRLPIRTYHTMATAASSTANSSVHSSPNASSPSSPLLRSNPRPATLSRQRSQTTCGMPSADANLSRSQQEKASAQSVWRRRYTGRQLECVVCLEEYVDGQSQVMSLPCGHEFHAECITPWLTTRRRTCPICKGDVVRSMAGPSSSNDRRSDIEGDSDDIQAQVAETANNSPTSAMPVATFADEDESDLERGFDDSTTSLLSDSRASSPQRSSGWSGALASMSRSFFTRGSSRQNVDGTDRSR